MTGAIQWLVADTILERLIEVSSSAVAPPISVAVTATCVRSRSFFHNPPSGA